MNKLLSPFPFNIFGINITIPSALMLFWIVLLILNVTLWGSLGVVYAVKEII